MKLTKHAWVLWGIALAAVLVLAFVIPFSRGTVYWIGLGCTVLMFAVCACAFYRAFRKDGKLESKLLGWPIFKVGYAALILQVIAGFALMGLSSLCPVWVAVIAEVLLFACVLFSLTVKDAAREAVTQSEARVKDNTAGWKALRARADALAAASADPRVKKMAEEMRYMDPAAVETDGEIAAALTRMEEDPGDGNIEKVTALLSRRKAEAKYAKNRR